MSAEPAGLPYFDRLYSASTDPYGVAGRWYEIRKRSLLLASLPRPRFRSAYEPGCGTGELTAALALRCERLLASDFSEPALAIARVRMAAVPHVAVAHQVLPRDWPGRGARFDLIVLSEVGYFLAADGMAEVAAAIGRTLDDDGTLVACDWRPPFRERALPTADVHAALDAIGLQRLASHDEDDFSLRVWSRDARSVAQREGIR